MSGVLVLMGSGETAPTMVKPHRAIFERVGDRPAVLLDTPYGFQSNADDISARSVTYFAESVGRRVEPLSWRTEPAGVVERERALATLRGAGWIFAGPGSPTYALRQWRETAIPRLLAERLAGDAVVCFASAAALTLGSHAIPVYEIYKAGFEPHWVPGLNLMSTVVGLPAVVIPHYDNAEGGHHDTRYSYLGEGRLSTMERELPEESFILGVDEHTAVILDLTERTASVLGNGCLTIRRRGASTAYPAGAVLTFGELETGVAAEAPAAPGGGAREEIRVEDSLLATTARLDDAFYLALARREAAGCVAAILHLEQALLDWASDTNVSDERERARTSLRAMIVHLGELAEIGARDPREVVGPYVEALLELRTAARAGRDWSTSDAIRDRLSAAGVTVNDTPDGPTWSLTG